MFAYILQSIKRELLKIQIFFLLLSLSFGHHPFYHCDEYICSIMLFSTDFELFLRVKWKTELCNLMGKWFSNNNMGKDIEAFGSGHKCMGLCLFDCFTINMLLMIWHTITKTKTKTILRFTSASCGNKSMWTNPSLWFYSNFNTYFFRMYIFMYNTIIQN